MVTTSLEIQLWVRFTALFIQKICYSVNTGQNFSSIQPHNSEIKFFFFYFRYDSSHKTNPLQSIYAHRRQRTWTHANTVSRIQTRDSVFLHLRFKSSHSDRLKTQKLLEELFDASKI